MKKDVGLGQLSRKIKQHVDITVQHGHFVAYTRRMRRRVEKNNYLLENSGR